MDVDAEDITKLVMVSCILAGARQFVVDRPVIVEMKEAREDKEPKFTGWSNVRYVWQRPPNPQARTVQSTQPTLPEDLNLTKVQQHCAALEPYFRATHWHSGRVAVALGSFLAYVLGTDVAQGYLSLTTVFEALLSPGGTEITHQISERASYLLEHDEEGRYAIYKRMKQLYKTRSQLVHGAV